MAPGRLSIGFGHAGPMRSFDPSGLFEQVQVLFHIPPVPPPRPLILFHNTGPSDYMDEDEGEDFIEDVTTLNASPVKEEEQLPPKGRMGFFTNI